MINPAVRAELTLMAKRAYPGQDVRLGESADGDALYVYFRFDDGRMHTLVRVEHDAATVPGAMWAALDALLPERNPE